MTLTHDELALIERLLWNGIQLQGTPAQLTPTIALIDKVVLILRGQTAGEATAQSVDDGRPVS